MGYLGKHRVFRPMRRHPAVLISGGATTLVVMVTGVVAAKIAHDSPADTKITQVAVSGPSTQSRTAPTANAAPDDLPADGPGASGAPITHPPRVPAHHAPVGGDSAVGSGGNGTGNGGSTARKTEKKLVVTTPPKTTSPPADSPPADPPAGGSATDGSATDGSATDGSATDGSATDGSATDGSATDGSATDGSATNGSTTNGSTTTTPVDSAKDQSSAQSQTTSGAS